MLLGAPSLPARLRLRGLTNPLISFLIIAPFDLITLAFVLKRYLEDSCGWNDANDVLLISRRSFRPFFSFIFWILRETLLTHTTPMCQS